MRPVGGRIREVCALVEKLGPSESHQLYPHISFDKNAIRTYCSRAVDRGMMTYKDSKYTIVEGWREMTNDPKPWPTAAGHRPMVQPRPVTPRRPLPISFVFNLGGAS